MIHLIIVSILSVCLAYLGSKDKFKYGLELAFIMLFAFSGFRFNYGNDYLNYYQLYNVITDTSFSLQGIISKDIYEEMGWALLNYACVPITFFGLIIVVSLLTVSGVYYFVKNNVPKEWWTFAVLVYVFNFSFYALSLSMMRQSLAMSIFLVALHFMMRDKKLPSIAITYLASTFHTSALLLIPFMLIQYMHIKNTKKIVVLFTAIFFFFLVSSSLVESVFGYMLQTDDFEVYNSEGNMDGSSSIGIGAILLFIVPFVFFSLSLSYNYTPAEKNILILAMVTTVLIPLSLTAALFMRVTYYFNIIYLLAIPLAARSPINRSKLTLYLTLYFIGMFYTYYMTLNGATYQKAFSEYNTIFEFGLNQL